MSPSDVSVTEVLDRIAEPRRSEAYELLALHEAVSGETPVVWANRIIGFGRYEYRYDSGHSGVAPLLGFASNNTKHTIYLEESFTEKWPDLMVKLGPHKASKVCLYLTRLSKIDTAVLRELLKRSMAATA